MTIVHEPNRFVLSVDGQVAQLQYERTAQVMTITRTHVPEALGGRGIAAQLTKAAFDHARDAHLKISPACSYAAAWAKKHPEQQDLLV